MAKLGPDNDSTAYIYIYIQGVSLIGPKKNRTYQKSCSPSHFFKKNGLWLQTFCSKLSISAEWRWSNSRNPYFCSLFWYLCKTKIFKISPQSPQTPIFTVISEAEFLQRLVVGRNKHFQFFCFYTMFIGVWSDFWMCLSDLTSQTPKRQNPFKTGPQNTFRKHLKPLVL